MTISLKQAHFIAGATHLGNSPPDQGREVAFVGRSNSGKSSAINAITHNSKLARVSKLPGRTQQINFFEVTEQQRIVDLPGYGYAKAPLAVRQQWKTMVDNYIAQRESLQGLVVLVDSRLGLTELDWSLLQWCGHVNVPVHILLTKSDKLSRSAAASILLSVEKEIRAQNFTSGIQLFSALKGDGIAQVERVILHWLNLKNSS